MTTALRREQVLGYRVRAQQLDREEGELADTTVLDVGAQDTGPDGALWALAIRGVDVSGVSDDDLAMAWTIRGAPHVYRRSDLPHVATSVWPYSEADAAKRVFDATKPLKEAGIGALEALGEVARTMRSVVTEPMAKGEVSTRMTALMGRPYLRYCRPCQATHLYEMPFRLAALHAGLELRPRTSPPVLRPVPGFEWAGGAGRRYDVIRGYLRVYGPATPKQVAEYLEAPVKEVRAHWPADTVEVSLDGQTRWLLAEDADLLEAGPVRTTRLLGPYDLFLQARDRSLLVAEPRRAKELWPVLGRPGAVLSDGEIVGTWRPRKAGKSFAVRVELWTGDSTSLRGAVEEQAEKLAQYRGSRLSSVDFAE
ncbi:winged helix DNA-binding domain-containing protein [Halostreptopolyspora alba]|uniref:Winged helix DNA-binding domain-containing protein n=1 Tax=Halostreptopolyspora alba TaxID=2487137 RepID=A0A3N0EIA7_9ACTN|nr:winged helix DNA-binding domain-containing protein [Nocardiopsaceae bacterium YIM 96095]